MNGLADKVVEDEERVASVDYIKPIGFTTKEKNELKALDKVKRIMNLSDKGFEYLSNQFIHEEGNKVEGILNQWSREREK